MLSSCSALLPLPPLTVLFSAWTEQGRRWTLLFWGCLIPGGKRFEWVCVCNLVKQTLFWVKNSGRRTSSADSVCRCACVCSCSCCFLDQQPAVWDGDGASTGVQRPAAGAAACPGQSTGEEAPGPAAHQTSHPLPEDRANQLPCGGVTPNELGADWF